MMDRVRNFFNPNESRRKASLAMARLLTWHDMHGMSFRENIEASRRKSESRQIALGAWLIPWCEDTPARALNFDLAAPAVTYDLRRTGIGVLTRRPIEFSTITVAMPDLEDVWRFFECQVCHQSRRPGGWTLAGLQVIQLLELDPRDVTYFRSRIEDESAAALPATPAARWEPPVPG